MNNSCAFLAEAATAAVAAAGRRCFMPSHDSKEDEGCRIHTSYCVKGSKERVCKFWQANFLIKSAQASRRHCRPDSSCPAEEGHSKPPDLTCARTRALQGGNDAISK